MKKLLALFALTGLMLASTSAMAFQVSDGGYQNCSTGLTWPAGSLPVDYYINQNGSDNFSFSQVETIVQNSFDAWEQPCCSAFTARYQGATSRTAYQSGGLVVLSWVENQWDDGWGPIDRVIGITLTSFNPQACTIGNAPIVFNGVRFNFTSSGSGTDLQSIATHEIGHLLGLDHSQVYEATMYFQYQGGTIGRSLHSDDQSGVCYLYNRPCTCNSSNDCLQGDICQNGTCRDVPCTANSDCQTGLECDTSTGECRVPPCGSDADCPGGFYCKANGACASQCPVCRDCQTNSDCGQNGVCLQSGKCVTFCQNGQCPGDSACYSIQGTNVCVNDTINQEGVCPTDYVCMGGAPENECNLDSDCAFGQRCENNACAAVTDPCDAVRCGTDQTCVNGECVNESTNNANNSNNTNNSTGNNDPGNNSTGNNDTGNNNTGNNGGNNQGQQEDIIIIVDEGQSDSSCSAAASNASETSAALALLLLGLLGLRRR